jgi:hypothetical protein
MLPAGKGRVLLRKWRRQHPVQGKQENMSKVPCSSTYCTFSEMRVRRSKSISMNPKIQREESKFVKEGAWKSDTAR